MGQLRDVDAPAGHVRGHQEAQALGPHPGQNLLALVLGQIRGKLVGVVAELLEHGADEVHVALLVAEDDRLGGLLHLDDAHEAALPAHGRDLVVGVGDLGHVDLGPGEREHLGLVQELLGQPEHVAREGGREHRGVHLAFGQVALDLLHVRVEADGEHPVGLVEHEHAQVVQGQGALEQVVQDAARGADHQVGALLEGLDLRAVAHSAVDRDDPQPGVGQEGLGLAGHLVGQLAGGHQDQGLALGAGGVQELEHGQDKGPGLAAAGAGLDHHVPTLHERRQALGLDRGERGPAGAVAGGAQGLGQGFQGEFGQGGFRLGGVGGVRGRCVLFVFHARSLPHKPVQGKARWRPTAEKAHGAGRPKNARARRGKPASPGRIGHTRGFAVFEATRPARNVQRPTGRPCGAPPRGSRDDRASAPARPPCPRAGHCGPRRPCSGSRPGPPGPR